MKLKDFLHKIYPEWSGYLYRSSDDAGGNFFHVNRKGAGFYQSGDAQLRVYETPDIDVAAVVNPEHSEEFPADYGPINVLGVEELAQLSNLSEEDIEEAWVLALDEVAPKLTKRGAVVVDGETGASYNETPIEVALPVSPKLATDPDSFAEAM